MLESRKRLRFILLTVVPCLITILLAGIYILKLWPSLNLTLVNILCVPLVTIVLVHGLTEEVNVLKAFQFAASILISGIEAFLNADGLTFETFHFGNLSLWGCAWIGVLALCVILFLVVLIRLLHWTQEGWREVRKKRQERRMAHKEFWAKYILAWQQRQFDAQKNRQEQCEQKMSHEKDKLRDKQASEKQKRDQEYERQRIGQEYQKKKQEEKFKDWKDAIERKRQNKAADIHPVRSTALNIVKIVSRPVLFSLIVIVLAILFWRVPYCVSAKMEIENARWMDYVVEFVDSLSNQDDKQVTNPQDSQVKSDGTTDQFTSNNLTNEDGQQQKDNSDVSRTPSPVQALIYYLLLFIVAVSAITMLLVILWNLAGRLTHQKATNLNFDFTKDYDLPISILLVFIAILYILGGNGFNFDMLNRASHWWQVLCFIIILVIVVFVTIEVILIIIKQCSQPGSLLKNIVYLTFIAILEFVSSLLLSVITHFRIQNVVSGLLSLIFMPDDTNSFANDVESKRQALFRWEVNHNPPNSNSRFKRSYGRRRIWRRYRK